MTKRAQIIGKINELEKALQELRIEILEEDTNEHKKKNKEELRVGDEVTILNPKRGQRSHGTICKYNKVTGYVTVQTESGKIVRSRSNIQAKENE